MGTKISELTTADALDGTETIALVQDSETVKATVKKVRLIVAAGSVTSAGSLGAGEVGVASAVRTGLGAYTITLDAAPTSGLLLTTAVEEGIAMQDGPFAGTAVDVLTVDLAGAAADVGFNFLVMDVG